MRSGGAAVQFIIGAIKRAACLEAVVMVLAAGTVLAVLFQDTLTKKTLRIGPADLGRIYESYVYDDESNGGSSRVALDKQRPLDWRCQLGTSYRYGYCGFGLTFDPKDSRRGIDMSSFDLIELKLRYHGPGKAIRLVLKNHDDKYARAGHAPVDKVIQGNFEVSQDRQIVDVQLADLAVAEWWRDATGVSQELARPEFHNVVALEVLTGVESAPGEHRFAVEEVLLTGRIVSLETWYGGMALTWIFLITCFLLHRRRQISHWRRQLADSWWTTLNTIPQMVWSLDDKGAAQYNRRWEDFTGVPLSSEGGMDPHDLMHADDRHSAFHEWKRCEAAGEPFEIEYRLKHWSGEYRWVLARAVPARDESGAIVGWYGTCTDVHDRVIAQQALTRSVASERRKSEQLRWASEHDALTSLPNRRAFHVRLQDAIARARDTGDQIGLLVFDLDHFKHVNDTLGHSAGDDLLCAVAERLANSVRQTDLVARMGGDEFAIILERIDSEEHLQSIGDAVSAGLQVPAQIGDYVVRPSASIGGALFPKHATTADALVNSADAALYALKRSGRGGIKLFHPEMLEQVRRAAAQLALAREIISDESIIALYQRKIHLGTGAVAGFEALLRWKHPVNGLQSPDTLEEAFKDYELAAKLGELMQRNVAGDIRSWLDRGVAFGRISINAAPAEFLRDDYAERLLKLLADYEVPPTSLEVEVTEQSLIERGQDFVARALEKLTEAGVRVSLDDFGTGFSSLSHLRDFPVDIVKVDMSFIQQMDKDQEIASIVTAVVSLAHSLGIDAVAEGLESSAQLQMLRLMGCHMAQGHLLGQAVEADAVAEQTAGVQLAA